MKQEGDLGWRKSRVLGGQLVLKNEHTISIVDMLRREGNIKQNQ